MAEGNHPSWLNNRITGMGNRLAPVFLQDMMPLHWGTAVWTVILESKWVAKTRNVWQLETLNRKEWLKKKRLGQVYECTGCTLMAMEQHRWMCTTGTEKKVGQSMESVWGAWWSSRLTWERNVEWRFRLCRNGELTLFHGLFLKVAHCCAGVWECCMLGPSRGLPHSRAPQIISD